MPSPHLVFPRLDHSDLIYMKIFPLEIGIRKLKKTFKTLFTSTIQLVSMEMGWKIFSGVNS